VVVENARAIALGLGPLRLGTPRRGFNARRVANDVLQRHVNRGVVEIVVVCRIGSCDDLLVCDVSMVVLDFG